jgi:GTPase Era involved in 16S rRNA processing
MTVAPVNASQAVTNLVEYLETDGYVGQLLQRCELTRLCPLLRERVAWLAPQAKMLTVGIAGEFSAGKSSLVNALLRRTVSFVDVWVASATIAVITSGSDEGVSWHTPAGSPEKKTLAEYLQLCRDRKLDDVREVQVIVDHNLPLVIVDTPGMGAISEKHQALADEAVLRADLLLWVIDHAKLMTAQEAGLLLRAKAIGMPVWCVLNKVDELSVEQQEECIGVLEERLGYSREVVFPVSATEALENGCEPGVDALRERLVAQTGQVTETQKKAADAKCREIVDESRAALGKLVQKAETDREWLSREQAILRDQTEGIRRAARDQLRESLADTLTDFLRIRVPSLTSSGTPPKDIAAQVIDEFNRDHLPTAARKVAQQIEDRAKLVWEQEFADRTSDLQQQIARFASDDMDVESRQYLGEQLATVTERREAVREGFSMTPFAVIAGIPLMFVHPLVGIAVLLGGLWMDGERENNTAVRGATQLTSGFERAVRECATNLASNIAAGQAGAAVDSYVGEVARRAADARARQRTGAPDAATVISTLARLQGFDKELDVARD